MIQVIQKLFFPSHIHIQDMLFLSTQNKFYPLLLPVMIFKEQNIKMVVFFITCLLCQFLCFTTIYK